MGGDWESWNTLEPFIHGFDFDSSRPVDKELAGSKHVVGFVFVRPKITEKLK